MARATAVYGAIGLPLLVVGMLMHSTQLCLAGAWIAGVAVVLHIVLILAGK